MSLTTKDFEALKAAKIGDTVTLDDGRRVELVNQKHTYCCDCPFHNPQSVCIQVGALAGLCVRRGISYRLAPTPHNELLNSVSAAHRLGVTVKKVREMARTGVIPAHKTGAAIGGHGRDWVFDSKDVEDYMNGMKFGAQELSLTTESDLATRLLPFEGVDEHTVWPIIRYRIEPVMDSPLYGAVGYPVHGTGCAFSGDYGTRAQAVEACRNDLRLRLNAVDELRRVS